MNKIQKFTRKYIKKKYEVIATMAFILWSTGVSGYYFGFVTPHNTNDVEAKTQVKTNPANPPVLDDRHSRILSDYMDQMIGACYYDLYVQNDTAPSTGNICDPAMLLTKQLCKERSFIACNSEFLRKYLEGMGQ